MPNPQPTRQRVFVAVTPKVTDLLFYEMKDISTMEIPAVGTPHHEKMRFPNHRFVHYETANDTGDKLRLWYLVPYESQDDYNWAFTDADIGGTRFRAVARTYVTPRSEWVGSTATTAGFNPDTPAMGTAMPDVPEGLFTGSYVLAERRETRSDDPKIDSLFVIEQRVYVKRVTMSEGSFDEVSRRNLTTSQTLYYSGETVPTTGSTIDALTADGGNAYWGLQDDGVVREWKRLSANWFAVSERQVVAGTFAEGVVSLGSYSGNVAYSWPPVLSDIELMDWVRKDGSIEIRPKVTYNPEGYSGPCSSVTSLTWSKTAFTIPKVDQMLPTGIHYSSPYYNVNTSECLHGAIEMKCDILRAYDPVYAQNVGSSRIFAATNHTEWPSTIVADDDQRPFRGGYLRTRVVVTKPS